MAKKVTKVLKLQIPGGAAVPGQQLGPVLGSAGINIGEFVSKFNEATRGMEGVVPAEITVYEDRTFDFILNFVGINLNHFNSASLRQFLSSATTLGAAMTRKGWPLNCSRGK